MKTLLIFLLLSSFITITAQRKDSLAQVNENFLTQAARQFMVGEQVNNTTTAIINNIMPFDSRYEGVRGTYYLVPIWLEGDLYGNNGKKLASRVSVKYDALNKEVIQRHNAKDSIALYPQAFTLHDNAGSYYFIYRPEFKTTSGKKIPKTYLQIMYLKKVGFYKNITKSLLTANYRGGYSLNRTYDSFEEKVEYFLSREDGEIELVKLNQKSFLQILQNKKSELTSYIKAQNLDLSKESDAIKLLIYYESIVFNK
jgi:hypothetical protein